MLPPQLGLDMELLRSDWVAFGLAVRLDLARARSERVAPSRDLRVILRERGCVERWVPGDRDWHACCSGSIHATAYFNIRPDPRAPRELQSDRENGR